MALRSALRKRRLFDRHRPTSPPVSLHFSHVPPSAAKTFFRHEYITSAAVDRATFFHRSALTHRPVMIPELISRPVGDELREKLRTINITSSMGLSVQGAKKLLRLAQVEKLKATLREIPEAAIPYAEFIRICGEGYGNKDQALELAKMLDDSGSVIVLGTAVFLRPEQVAKSMENIISKTVAFPGDPRRRELEEMEKQKGVIDEKALAQVRGELYCGLGFLALQTLGFMRLTFWELSWDVMEPICFFVTSLHFAGAYAFFLRTSKEPSFEGYFQRRFKTKQRRLMEVCGFDVDKYNELLRACRDSLSSYQFHTCSSFSAGEGELVEPRL